MKSWLTFFSILSAFGFMATMGLLQETQGQQPDPGTPPEALATPAETPVGGQYKVLDASRLTAEKDKSPAETLELTLNKLAKEGWMVAATSGSYIILSR